MINHNFIKLYIFCSVLHLLESNFAGYFQREHPISISKRKIAVFVRLIRHIQYSWPDAMFILLTKIGGLSSKGNF